MSEILIYGAGVIGSLYAVLLSKAGDTVTVFVRGERLRVLQEKGLLYREGKRVKKANITVLAELNPKKQYDFIFLTVRANQVTDALKELSNNESSAIVTMVNGIGDYEEWERLVGKGKILPAFPGAGGGFDGDVLEAGLTPGLIQRTSFGEINGERSIRLKKLHDIFKKAGIPSQEVSDMRVWQRYHLALVVPLADAYYEAEDPERVWENPTLMKKTAWRLKRNMRFLFRKTHKMIPAKFGIFLFLPNVVLTRLLSLLYKSDFGEKFMYRHAIKAGEEMKELHRMFYSSCRQIEKGK